MFKFTFWTLKKFTITSTNMVKQKTFFDKGFFTFFTHKFTFGMHTFFVIF